MKTKRQALPSPEQIGKTIRALREQRDLSLGEFAERIESDKATLCRFESGSRRPNLDALTAIATACGITVVQLLDLAAKS